MPTPPPQPLVSAVLPVFNREHTLPRAIASVQAQTFGDWELLVVDDASADESPAIAERFAAADARIRVLRHPANRGANAARNTGIREARGAWIALQDSDDEWLPNRLATQLALLETVRDSGKPEPDIVYGWHHEERPGGVRLLHAPQFEGNVHRDLLREFFAVSATLLIRRECFGRFGFLDAEMRSCQEYEFCIRASREAVFAVVRESIAVTHAHEGPRVGSDPAGWERLCDLYGPEMREAHGSALLARRRTFCGTLHRNRGHWRQAARQYRLAVREDPLSWGAWWRLAALPVWALTSRLVQA